ncbi:MAG: 4-(cytidine 5'-diphospho)-2-C-methyl-D-erythritol kinase [Armatimonadetes bacterium]|nr:4-(cytidine 5'-diphospho)-2-C-methyl-D-erythritol kinase [Armatimonadota bacterium]
MIRIHAFAKVNYTLDVLSPRPDGYHNLATVMQSISLSDTLEAERTRAGITLTCDAPGVPRDDRNLAVAAVRALLAHHGRSEGIALRLRKRIPAEAGLGGGSSDAAAALRAADALLELQTPAGDLARVAAGIGSDVPFFLTGGAAAVRGRGEQVQPLPDGPEFHFVIVKPPVGVSTRKAYAALDAMPERRSARGTRRMEEALAKGDPAEVARRMTNDFEEAVFAQSPEVAAAYDSLLMGRASRALLCGSGACVLGVAASAEDSEAIGARLRLAGMQVHLCKTLTREQAMVIERE